MAMKRLPNGYGGIVKLSGNRRKPFRVYVNTTVTSGQDNNELASKLDNIDVSRITGDELMQLVNEVPNGYQELERFIKALRKQCEFKAKTKQVSLGYFATYKEASIFLAEYNKSPYDATQSHTFAEVYQQAYCDAKVDTKSESSISAYKTAFKRCEPIHQKDIKDIKLADLQAIVDANTGRSKSIQDRLLITFRMVYRFAMKHELVNKDYSQYVTIGETKEVKAKNVFTLDEIKLLWDNIDYIPDGYSFKIAQMLILMIYTGVRVGEMLNIKLSDIDGDMIHVRGTKSKVADRFVPIHPSIQPVIDSLLTTNKKYLIESTTGERYSANTLRNTHLVHLNNDLHLLHTFHETRHSFATYSTGMDTVIRSYIIAHSNNNITDDIYTHPEVLRERLRSEIRKLEC